MTFIRQMDIADQTISTVEAIDSPDEREFEVGGGLSPVAAIGHEHKRPWGESGNEFGITSATG